MHLPTRLFGLCVLGWLAAALPAHAGHFAIDLHVGSDKEGKTVHADILAPGVKPRPREVLAVRAGAPIKVKWTVTCTARKETFKDVVVHLFVVKERTVGQAALPKLDKGVPVESALTMDFKPRSRARGKVDVKLTIPGAYLLRLETIGAAVGIDGHEHFAALDLVVK